MDMFSKRFAVIAVLIPTLVILITLGTVFKDAGQVVLTEQDSSITISYKALSDLSYTLDAKKAYQAFQSIEEKKVNSTLAGISDGIYWYQIKLTNNLESKRNISVFVDNPVIDKIDVFDIARGFDPIVQMGDKRINNSPNMLAFPNITLEFQPSETKTILFKTEASGPKSSFFLIFEEKDFNQYREAVYLIVGGLIGTVLLMCIYNLILFLGVKEKLYLIYIGYVFSMLLLLTAIHGFLGYLVPVILLDFMLTNIVSLNFLVAYFAILFGLYFLEFDKEPTRTITKATKFTSKFYLAAAVISLIVDEQISAPIFFVSQLVLYGFAGYFVYAKVREKLRWVNFYLVSWLPLLVGAVVGPMLLLGFIEYSFWARYALLFGVLFEMTFISMGLAERLRTSENKRLYEANHDNVFNLSNVNLLNQQYINLTENHRTAKFSLLVIRIGKYASTVPYIGADQLKVLVNKFVSDIEQHFSTELSLQSFDSLSTHKNVVLIREGVFALIVNGDDQSALNRAIKQFAQRQPLPYNVDQLSINFNCYISAVSYHKGIESLNDLISSGLQEIEVAISNGRNYGIFDSESHKVVQRKVQLASDISKALEMSQFYLAHQPQIDLKTKSVVASEVLIRWEHEEFGFVPPDEFIKIAEQTGAINKISEWVFLESCKHLAVLIEKGHRDHKLSVNISVFDVSNDDFIWYLVQTINKLKLTADMFILEITETALVEDLSRFRRNVLHLKELGFGLAIDDFGTGYSSLIYVSKHPFDEIKIDREFVFFLTQSDTDKTIVSTTITMAKSLDIKVVAEGIENSETGDLLLELGCDIVQGYHYAKPLKFDDYLEWLERPSEQIA